MRLLLLALLALLALAPPAAAKVPPADGCTDKQRATIQEAMTAARGRTARAAEKVKAGDKAVDAAAKALFYPDYKDKMALQTWVMDIYRALEDPELPLKCGAKSSDRCKNASAYVPRDDDDQIVFCPDFFATETLEHRARIALHESAHVAGAIPEEHEVYCGMFSCDSPCSDQVTAPEYNAENWAQFMYCADGGKTEAIEIKYHDPRKSAKKEGKP